MKLSTVGAAVLTCTALAGGAYAWQAATSTNQTVLTEIANARPGSTIIVPATFDGQLVISGKHFSSPVTIVNNSALVQSLVIRDSSNIIVEGGAVVGGTGINYAVHIDRARSVAVRGMTLTNTVRAMVIVNSEAIGVFQNRITGVRSDGINIAGSRNVVVEGNSCANFNPIKPIYDEAGKLITDGDHPDCIQSWSIPTSPPNSDLVIRGNSMTGDMQGIFLGNKVRNGIDDGGYDRVVIENNYVNISHGNGIRLEGVRGARVAHNQVLTIEGSRFLNGAGSLVKAAIYSLSSINVVACSNIVQAIPNGFGTEACAGATPPPTETTPPPPEPAPAAPAEAPPPAPEPTPIAAVETPAPAPAPTETATTPPLPAPTPVALEPVAPVLPPETVTTEPVLAVVQAVITQPTVATKPLSPKQMRKLARRNQQFTAVQPVVSATPTVQRAPAPAAIAPVPQVTAPPRTAAAPLPVLAVAQSIAAQQGTGTSAARPNTRQRNGELGTTNID